ncbi:WXG100 family type VII secretion target [Mycobacterium tuberculosis]|uniref:WXG100 family type VII secretion target n=2 Tax=Mycobacterium tuberculosis TaxID=1773 RepID=UPI0030F080CA
MSQSMYSYPAMTANVGDMAGYTGTTQSLGADIASERTAPSRACQGDLGMSHQDWQAQWNQAMEALARAYRRCRRALRQIGVLERPVGDSSDCGTIRVGSFRGRWGGAPPPGAPPPPPPRGETRGGGNESTN